MTIVAVGSLRLAAGLSWQFHADRREHRTAARQRQVESCVEVPCDDGLLSGWYAPGSGPGGRLFAGGLVVGALAPDAVVYHEIEPGRVWVCALRDGLPLPDTDRVDDPVAVDAVLSEVLAYQPDMPIFGTHPAARARLDVLLCDVVPARTFRLHRPGADRRRQVAAAGLVAAILLLAWIGLRPEPDHRPLPVVEGSPAAPVVTRLPSLPRQLRGPGQEQFDAALREATEAWLQRPSFGATVGAWLATLRTLPPSRVGYRPRLLECQTDHCTAEWVWTGGIFTSAVPGALPGVLQPVSAPRDYASQVRTRLPLPAREKQRMPVVDASAVEGFVHSATAALTQPGVRLEVQSPKAPITLSVEVEGERRDEVIGHYGLLRVSASNLVAAEHILRILSDYPVSAERTSFTITGGSISFTLEARYVVLRS